jgi:dihydrodipicolinate synthase/N-acetylneuraminate lyase
MPPLNARQIIGNWATLLLPINTDDSIDYARLGDEIDAIIAAEVNGVYSNGTAGEFHTQSENEFDRVSALLAEKCERARLPFQIGVSHMSAQISLSRLNRIKRLKPSAVQIVLPDWFPLTDDEATNFLKHMADEAAPIPLILYNPPHAKRRLEPRTIAFLAERVPQLVGVKVPAGDATWWRDLGDASARISVFVPGHFLATHLPSGAAGAYSNVACLSPSGAQKWWELMNRDHSAAMDIERRLRAFLDAHITPFITQQKYCNAAVDKLLAAIGAWTNVGTRLRWPYRWIEPSEAVRLRPHALDSVPELLL